MFSFLIKFFNPYDFIPTFIHIKTELRSTCVGVTNRQTLVSGNVSSTICNAVLPTPFPRYSGEMKNSSISPLTLFVAFTTAQPTMLFSARTDSIVMSFSLNSAVNSFFSFSSSEKGGKMPFSKYFAWVLNASASIAASSANSCSFVRSNEIFTTNPSKKILGLSRLSNRPSSLDILSDRRPASLPPAIPYTTVYCPLMKLFIYLYCSSLTSCL